MILRHCLELRYRQRSVVISALLFSVLVLVLLFLFPHGHTRQFISQLHSGTYTLYSSPLPAAEDFAQIVSALWKPHVHGLQTSNFTTKTGREYSIWSGNHLWDRPLGKDVLILDIDTRFDDPGNASGANLTPRRAGRLNHYIYSLIHGYDYRFIHAPRYWFRHQTWVKVPMIKEALKTHKFVIFLDSDAVFAEPQMPIEWLLNLWNVHDSTLLAMAEDPGLTKNLDTRGWVLWNTGFIISQQSPRTRELFQAWEDCPSNVQFPGCGRWSQDWAHEQAAFGNYIRYAYNETDELRAISCMDGNGQPNIPYKKCGGVFVSHYWSRKRRTVADLHDMVTKGLALQGDVGSHDLVFEALGTPKRNRWNQALNDLLLNLDLS